MYIDMHVHSKRSDDAGGTVEGYLKWINVLRKKGYQVDGIALTEHRGFDFEVDYTSLADQYDALVIKGAEIETDLGARSGLWDNPLAGGPVRFQGHYASSQ